MRWSGRGDGWRWPPGVRPRCISKPGTPLSAGARRNGASACRLVVNNSRLYVLPERPLPQSGQPVYEAHARTVECGLAERVATSGRVGGEFCGPQPLSRHGLQGQWLEPVGAHARLEAQRGGLLRAARGSQASVDSRVGEERVRQAPGGGVAGRLGQCPATRPPPLHRQGQGDGELDGAFRPGRAGVSAPAGVGVSAPQACWCSSPWPRSAG